MALTLAESSRVRLSVFDVLGREVAVLLDGQMEAGERIVGADTATRPARVYVIRLTAAEATVVRRVTAAR